MGRRGREHELTSATAGLRGADRGWDLRSSGIYFGSQSDLEEHGEGPTTVVEVAGGMKPLPTRGETVASFFPRFPEGRLRSAAPPANEVDG